MKNLVSIQYKVIQYQKFADIKITTNTFYYSNRHIFAFRGEQRVLICVLNA